MVQEDESRGRIFTTTPQFPSPPSVPEPPRTERRFQVAEIEIRPLAGPDIPLPPEGDEEVRRRFDVWRARTSGSLPEFIVYEWLTFVKKQVEGVDYLFQHPLLGGRTEFGGFVLDFYFPIKRTGWRIQGERFHLLQTRDRARDAIAKALLEGRGIKTLDLWEDDILTRTNFVLNSAWEGRELHRASLD